MSGDETPSFEDALHQLEAIVDRLEQEALPLDDAIDLFEQGMRLVARCAAHLERTDLRLTEIESALGEALAALDEAVEVPGERYRAGLDD